MHLIDARGTLHREANDVTHLDIQVDGLTLIAIFVTAVEVSIALVVFALLTAAASETVGYVGLAIVVAFLALERVRYSWTFRMQTIAFFGEKWWK
jgi:hypothetical protein